MKVIRRLVWGLLLAALAALIGMEMYLRTPIVHPETVITVTQGAPLTQIARSLELSGAITHPELFIVYGRLHGDDRAIKAGEYVISSGMSPRQIMHKFILGMSRTFKIQVIEGWNLQQIAEHLSQAPFVTDKTAFVRDFLTACRDPARIARLGIKASSLEGFLFPDTYHIRRPRNAGEIVDVLTDAFRRQYKKHLAGIAVPNGLDLLQIVTLASIIEKETGAAAERKLVSAVFHNRLRKGMKLETDPTGIYGLKDYDGVIHQSDLRNPHPYNTYIHAGLPPGPIASPGLASLEAAVHPADVPYLYFVSRNDGTHIFSEHYADHLKAVRKYQR